MRYVARRGPPSLRWAKLTPEGASVPSYAISAAVVLAWFANREIRTGSVVRVGRKGSVLYSFLQGVNGYPGERWVLPCPPFSPFDRATKRGLSHYVTLSTRDDGFTFFKALEMVKAVRVEV